MAVLGVNIDTNVAEEKCSESWLIFLMIAENVRKKDDSIYAPTVS